MAMFGALAAVGLALAIEGSMHGLFLHRAAAVAIGAALALPLAFALAFGERFLRWSSRLGLSALSVGIVFAGAELVLRAFGGRFNRAPELRFDNALGHHFLGGRGEPDDWGYRNPGVPARADVVCLGDSQTWGTAVSMSNTWPRLLAQRTGLEVYNMGIGGYGPLQYRALTERALSLGPRTLLIGFFLGNDVTESYSYAGLETYRELRDPSMSYPVRPSAWMEEKPPANLALAAVEALMRHSRVAWRAVYQIKFRMRMDRHLADLYWREPGDPHYARAPLETYFKPTYNAELEDLDLAYVRDGLRITRIAIARIADEAEQRGVHLGMLLIPTKEACYFELAQRRGEEPLPGLERVAKAEEALRQRVLELAAELRIRVADPRSDLLSALTADQPLWPATVDGHFIAAGTTILAAVAQREFSDWLGAR